MADEFPAEILQFIDKHIESLAQLEGLLLLHRDQQRAWDADQIAKSLYITRDMADSLLADMTQRGFVRPEPPGGDRYVYQAPNANVDRLIAKLDSIYQVRRVAVISHIYSKPLNKVQTFADAFRLRKENP